MKYRVRWWRRRARLPEPETGGREAHADAQRQLREVVERWPDVARLGDRLSETIGRNHLSEAIQRAMRGTR